jgi:hypothetical protein
MRAQLISISEASRLLGKARETIMKAAEGLDAKPGPKNTKLYNANALFMAVYCGNECARLWEGDDMFWRGEFDFPDETPICDE